MQNWYHKARILLNAIRQIGVSEVDDGSSTPRARQ